jgi:hypothetical protein
VAIALRRLCPPRLDVGPSTGHTHGKHSEDGRMDKKAKTPKKPKQPKKDKAK